jgi:hypothetical protein
MPVDFERWVTRSFQRIKSDPKRGPSQSLYYAYVGALLTLTKRYPLGTNIYERDWDLLVVLDACRVDSMREVAGEYSYIDHVDSVRSVGSTSFEWLPLTFNKRYKQQISETAYVSGNPYLTPVFENKDHPPVAQPIPFGPTDYNVVNPDEFLFFDEVRKYGVDEEHNCVLPRTMTDRAIDVNRSLDPDRLIVHYMQPHEPHIGEEHGLGQSVFVPLRKGEITREEAWDSYIENLRLVLDELEVLLTNVDAEKVVITADHGEAFGEFGFYAHQIGCPLPAVRNVPWVETTATDQGNYEPEIDPEDGTDEESLEQHLAHLGYM